MSPDPKVYCYASALIVTGSGPSPACRFSCSAIRRARSRDLPAEPTKTRARGSPGSGMLLGPAGNAPSPRALSTAAGVRRYPDDDHDRMVLGTDRTVNCRAVTRSPDGLVD